MPAFRAMLVAFTVVLSLTTILDLVFVATFPRLPRLVTNYSAAYLRRELFDYARLPPRPVLTGDSVLWGYGLPQRQSMAALLSARGIQCENLSFEGGSPANSYAILRAMLAFGGRPRIFLFNVNQKEFNPADSAYSKLHPALERVVYNLLTPRDKAMLSAAAPVTLEQHVDAWLSETWHFYGMRSDLRQTLFGEPDAAHALANAIERLSGTSARAQIEHRVTSGLFEGTYDLNPLDEGNVSVYFLRKLVDLLVREHINAVAILTPTNHALLHDYIDSPQYKHNLTYIRGIVNRERVTILDEDAAFTTSEFIDNDHLTAEGTRHLAAIVAHTLQVYLR